MNPNAILRVKDSAPHHGGKVGYLWKMVGPNLDLVAIKTNRDKTFDCLIVVSQEDVEYAPRNTKVKKEGR